MGWRTTMLGMLMVCTLIVLAYLYARQLERRATLWLILFVTAGLVTAIPLVIGFSGFYDKWPGLTFLPTQMTLFFGPLIFLHARSLMLGNLSKRWLLLLVPGVAYWIYQLGAFLLLRDFDSPFLLDHQVKWAFNNAIHYPYILPIVFYSGLLLTIWAMYDIWRLLERYKVWLENNRSDNEIFQPIWLTHLIYIGVPLIAVWGVENILGRYFGFDYFERFWADFSSLLLLFLISLEALFQIRQPFPKMGKTSNEFYETPGNKSPQDWKENAANLQKQVTENEWYLENGLSLDDLARRMATNRAYLSRTLNDGLGTSFSKFINKLRVEHAKTQIQDGNRAMLNIAIESGFGSKASFNRAFKYHTGMTPTQYVQSQHAQTNT